MRNLAPILSTALLLACGEVAPPNLPDGGVVDSGVSPPDAAADSGICAAADPCSEADTTRCGAGGLERCTEVDGCLTWTPESCAGACVDGACHPCGGGIGTFSDQSIEVDGETRSYFLHVPPTYDCSAGAPLWVDFHGTAGDRPEEAYRTAELVAVADREGAIVVRPRSRSSDTGGGRIYRWDQNPGDIERNVRFTDALIDALDVLYHLDPDCRYASGFSSGANMVAQFLGRGRSEFRGVAMVGGGYWADPSIPDLTGSALRVYAVTGYRDYLIDTLLPLLSELEADGLPSERIFFRQTDSGHELYGWELSEIWRWLDRGERPADQSLSARWMIDPTFPGDDALIQLDVNAAGDLLATSRTGRIFRGSGGGWSEVGHVTGQLAGPLTGICLLPSGRGVAVGGGGLALTDDGGAHWRTAPSAPELAGQYFGYAYLNDVACFGARSMLAAGYWSGVRSDDGAETYRGAQLSLAGFDIPAQVAAVAVSSSSTAVAAGYFYLGRSDDAETFTDVGIPAGLEWLNAVASGPGGRWWIAGEMGTIAKSTDDGFNFSIQPTPTTEDLYAIDFYDENVGLAVGLHGAALYTDDGGTTWQDVSIGLDRFLGDVRWIDASTAVAVGENGTVLDFAR